MPYVFSLIGDWPDGIVIDPDTGAVSGMPVETGVFTGLSVRVTDDLLNTADLPTFSLTVATAAVGTATGTGTATGVAAGSDAVGTAAGTSTAAGISQASAHRYWRLYFDQSADAQTYTALIEIELRETISGADATGSGTASADSVNTTFVAANAFDNNAGTRWQSAATYPHWLKYDFGASNDKDINEIAMTVYSTVGQPRDFALQYSDDDSVWTTKWRINGEDAWTASEQRIFSDPAAPALYSYPGIVDAYDILGSAIKGWYAADLITGSDGDAQAYWHDISGQLMFMRQKNSSLRPTLETTEQNSLNVLRFTAADIERMAIPYPMLAGSTAASVYIVMKSQTDPPVDAASGIWVIGSAASTDHHPFSDNIIYNGFASTARKTAGNFSGAMTSWRIYGFHSAASDWALYIDGTSFYSTGTNTVGIALRPYFGESYSAGYNFDGMVGEIIFTNAVQTQEERELVEGYLAHKWGLTANLPIGHPYETDPPGSPPTITSPDTLTISSLTQLSHALTVNISSTWSIVGGADQADFQLTGSELQWDSDGTQDYDAPADADTDNDYIVTVRATTVIGAATTDQTITVTVIPLMEGAMLAGIKLDTTGDSVAKQMMVPGLLPGTFYSGT